MKALRMLRTLTPALPDYAPDHHGNTNRATVHVMRLGSHVDELVHSKHDEIHAYVHVDGAEPGHRGPNGNTGHGIFGERGIENTPRAKPRLQAASRTLDGFVIIDIQSEKEDARIAFHFLGNGFAESVDIPQETLLRRFEHAPMRLARRRHS
jgi:hypothetical protein